MFGFFNSVDFEVRLALDGDWGFDVVRLLLVLLTIAIGAAGTVFYPGLLDRIVGMERGHNERQSLGYILRTLPYGRLVLADLLLVAATAAGFVLLVVPGVIVFTLLCLVGPVITIEDRGVIDALRRSARLVRPHFWLVLVMVPVPLGVEHFVEDLVHHAVEHEQLIVRFVSHGLVGVVIGSVVGLIEVHLAFRLSGREKARAVSRRPGEAPSAAS